MFLLPLILVCASAFITSACECISPESIADVQPADDIIFLGQVISARRKSVHLVFDVGEMNYIEEKVVFKTDTVLKGPLSDTHTVYFYEERSPCDRKKAEFTFGQRLLISAKKCPGAKDRYCNDSCSLRLHVKKNIFQKRTEKKIQTDTTHPSDTLPAPPPRKYKWRFFRKKKAQRQTDKSS